MEWNAMVRVVNSVESTEISKKLWTSGHESDEHCGTRFPLSANSWTKKGKPVTEFLRRAFQQKSLREEQNQGAKAFDSNALCNADHDRYGKRGKATLSLKENRFEYFAPSPSMTMISNTEIKQHESIGNSELLRIAFQKCNKKRKIESTHASPLSEKENGGSTPIQSKLSVKNSGKLITPGNALKNANGGSQAVGGDRKSVAVRHTIHPHILH